jgi:hypothetical protein
VRVYANAGIILYYVCVRVCVRWGVQIPARGVTDPCCSNMAWVVDSKSGTISSVWNSSLCFRMRGGGGGELAKCDGSASQKWSLKKVSTDHIDGSTTEQYQILSSAGQCITDVVSTAENPLRDPTSSAAPLVFDVKASLGWQKGAKVRDLWKHLDLGVMNKITARLTGDGDSSLFRLSPA